MSIQVTMTPAYVVIIDTEVLLLFAANRDEAIRRLISDSLMKGRDQEVSVDDVLVSLSNGFIRLLEINGGVFAEPWQGSLPEGL